jgi:hypothetical protein
MAPDKCQHSKVVSTLVKLDFVRPDDVDGPVYSGTVSAGVCEDCGQIKLYAKNHRLLVDWLLKA